MKIRFLLLVAIVVLVGGDNATGQTPWVTAYYAGWTKWNARPVDIPQIDFTCATHWVFFTLSPSSDGTFSGSGSGIDAARHTEFVNAVHAQGKLAIIGTGGWGSDYTGAVTNRATSIAYLTNLMTTYGYDGVDIDWEPVPSGQYTNFATWVRDLKTAMVAIKPNAVLTAAGFTYDQALVNSRQYLDQINLMTYDMSGPWPGWVSWHNSAIYNGGAVFPSTGGPLPAIDLSVNQYIQGGVAASKIGFGIEFYGYVWSGVTAPQQTGFGTVRSTVPYFEIMDTYGGRALLWDQAAQAAYYATSSQFVSFDAETTLSVKARYCQQKGLGGVIIYEVAGGYRHGQSVPDRLLKATKAAFLGGAPPPTDRIPPTVSISAPAANASVTALVTVGATASDNEGVGSVQFRLDGSAFGNDAMVAPYTASLNTWNFANGAHTLSAVARDWAGNTATASVQITIANTGPPPPMPDKVVYADALQAPFTNTSWSATVSFNNTNPSKNGSNSVRVDYQAWGGFDILSGTWGAEVPIDPTLYDSLVFDIYPTTQFDVGVGFYTGGETLISGLPANQWTACGISIPLDPFSRFFVGSKSGTAHTAFFDNIRFSGRAITSGTGPEPTTPLDFALEQNFPNPFNPSTTIRFTVPGSGNVTLKVYDLLGQLVATLVDGPRDRGTHQVVFDPAAAGKTLSSGVYLYQLSAGSFVETRRLMFVK